MTLNKSALIIDDSPSIREFLQAILKDELNFADIQVACCADEGIDILESDHQKEINWVITDWEMPGKPVGDLFEYVNKNYTRSELNLVLITGKNTSEARRLADDMQAHDFISKPFNALVSKLKRLMGLNERRCATRVNPCVPCEVDIGFDNYGRHGAEIINISESGCLLSMQHLDNQAAHVYDIATLIFTFHDNTNLDVDAQIVRVERDNGSTASEQKVSVAFEFKKLDKPAIAKLQAYVNQCQLVVKADTQSVS